MNWYYRVNGQDCGPVSVKELKLLAARNQLAPSDQVRSTDSAHWVAADSVPSLFDNLDGGPRESRSASMGASPTSTVVASAGSVSAIGPTTAATPQSTTVPHARAVAPITPPPRESGRESRRWQHVMMLSGALAGLLIMMLLLLLLWLMRPPSGSEMAGGGLGDGSQVGAGDSQAENVGGGGTAPEGGTSQAPDAPVEEEQVTEDTTAPTPGPPSKTPTSAPIDPPPAQASATFAELTVDAGGGAENDAAAREGGGTGEFKRRLEREGAKTGDVQISLIWDNRNDLDLHVVCPSGEEIFFGHRRSACGGDLDVDQNVHAETDKPVENVYWPTGQVPEGTFRVFVIHYHNHGLRDCRDPTSFRVAVNVHGKSRIFRGKISFGDPPKAAHEFKVR